MYNTVLWCCDVMKLCIFKLVLLFSQKSLLSYVNYKCTFYSFFFIYEKKIQCFDYGKLV